MALGLTLAHEGHYVLARGSYRQHSVGRCCGSHRWVGRGELGWLRHRGELGWLRHKGWRRKRSWELVSHHWRVTVDWLVDWLLDREIGSLVIMSLASTRDSLSSSREVSSSRGVSSNRDWDMERERYWEVLISLDGDHGVEW